MAKDAKPKFEPLEPGATAQADFVRKAEPKASVQVDLFKPELPELPAVAPPTTTLVAVKPPEADESSEEGATDESGESFEVVPEKRSKFTIEPHIEVDYSRYGSIGYRRIDPVIQPRSVQIEAVDTWFSEQDKRRVIIHLPTGCIDGKAIVQINRHGENSEDCHISLAFLCYMFNGGVGPYGETWDHSKEKTLVRSLVGRELLLNEIEAVLDQGEKDVVELEFASGKRLVLTPDHEICIGVSANGEHLYCQACKLEPGQFVAADSSNTLVMDSVVSCRSLGKRRVYDIVCKDPWRNFVANGIVVHNCGKTVAGMMIVGRLSGRVLWIAHRDELISQPHCEVTTNFPGIGVGIEKASENTGRGQRLCIASIQTLSKKERLKDIMEGAPFCAVIYDECHHAVGAQAIKVLSWLGCFRKDNLGPRLLGLTATTSRSDKTSLGHVFEEVIYSVPISKAIELGYLVPPISKKVPLPIDKKSLRTINGDYVTSDMDRELARVNAAQATAVAIMAHCGKRKTMVFTTSVDQAIRTAAACEKLGLKADWVAGAPYMNKPRRKEVLRQSAAGDIQVIVSSDLLTEGYDDRTIEAVVIAKPTKSQGRYTQMVGRGLRTNHGKVDCLVIDITGVSDMGFMSADLLLKAPDAKIIKKRKKTTSDKPKDSQTEWQRLQSYLRSTSGKIDTIEHGDITFARVSDDLILTVAKDRHFVILRRVSQDGADQWVIEHDGLNYSMQPLTLQESMRVCDTLIPCFGGSAKPASPEWEAAASAPVPPPGLLPGATAAEEKPNLTHETTKVVDPRTQLPLAMTFATGMDPEELAQRVSSDIMNANAASFIKGLKLALRYKQGFLLGFDKHAPPGCEKLGWTVENPENKAIRKEIRHGPLLGWVYGDAVGIDPLEGVKLAEFMLRKVKDDTEIKTTYLRTHLGTVNKVFRGERRDWIKVNLKDLIS